MVKKYSLSQNLKYTYRLLLKYEGHRYSIFGMLRLIVEVMAPFFTMALPSVVIALLLASKDKGEVVLLVLGYAIILLLLHTCKNYLEQRTQTITFLFRIGVLEELVRKIMGIDYAYIESEEGQEQLTKAKRAILEGNEVGCEALINETLIFIINITGLIVYSIVSARLNIWILLFLVVTTLVVIYMNRRNRKWVENHKDCWTPYDKKLNYLYVQSIDTKNGKDIRLYKVKEWFLESFDELFNGRFKWYKDEYKRYYFAKVIERFMALLRDGIVYGYLIYEMVQGMSLDLFLLYLGVVAGFSIWMKKIFDSFHKMEMNSDIITDYRNFMTINDEEDNIDGMSILRSKTHEIKLEKVSFKYPGSDNYVLKNINLTIEEGEKLALVGMNGAGKSTLVKLICGLYTPTKGRILLDGIDIRRFSKAEYYTEFAVVFQDIFAFAFPIAQNVACAKEVDTDYQRIEECLKEAELWDKVKTLPKRMNTVMLKELDEEGIVFSGGEMQKLMLARALYKDASVVILDEPTAALDPIAENTMYEKYNSYIKGKTSIFISHRLSSTRFCNRIIFLKGGEIIEEGTHERLMKKNGEYANMYKIQSHYYSLEEQRKVADIVEEEEYCYEK